jgi:hypothetical protein
MYQQQLRRRRAPSEVDYTAMERKFDIVATRTSVEVKLPPTHFMIVSLRTLRLRFMAKI